MTEAKQDTALDTATLLWNEMARYEAMLTESRPDQAFIHTVARPEAVEEGAEFRIKVRGEELVVHVFPPAEGDTKGASDGDG